MTFDFWEEYQQEALKTGIYPDKGNNVLYPTLGLMSELGEVAGKLKKMLRDDGGVLTIDRQEALSGEIGDVLWYVAVLCSELGFEMKKITCDASKCTAPKELNVYQMVLETQISMGIISMNIIDNTKKESLTSVYSALKFIFFHIDDICTMLDLQIEQTAKDNLDKLVRRKKRGTLKGEGDKR